MKTQHWRRRERWEGEVAGAGRRAGRAVTRSLPVGVFSECACVAPTVPRASMLHIWSTRRPGEDERVVQQQQEQELQLQQRETPDWEAEDDGELALPAERRRREARQSARAAMRVRQGTLLDDAQNGGVLGGDAGTCHHGTDRLVELARATTADWARRAARSRWHSQGIGRGRGGRSGEALWRVHELVFVCGGCSGLVNGQAARVRAYAEGRLSFAGTDGCGSSACSGNHRSGSYRAGQASMARALLEGERRLVRWPSTTAHTHVWVVGDEERRMVAEGVLRSRGPEACWVRRS